MVSAHAPNPAMFSFKVYRDHSPQSGFDLECAEYTCFPSADSVSIIEENGQKACSAWVWARPVRALSAYAYQEALPLVRANMCPFNLGPPAGWRGSN